MGPLMAALNSHKVRGPNATSAYENVFGMPLHEPILGQVSQLRECFTVRERLDLLPDPELEAALRADLIIDGKPEEVPKDYWEEGEGSDSGDSCGDDNEPWAADDDEPTQTVMATTGSDSGDSCGDDNKPWEAHGDEPTATVMATTIASNGQQDVQSNIEAAANDKMEDDNVDTKSAQ
ncbi:hypothetical protein IV203_010408 [Nitzschia inconspicua]|uniref:Uncharacterized protein n=1 Tax=Nitzschia inconspicua TaxID=303405 RepID=A0A9K3KXJ5_9STRA|nr:hypothetical protein IV203_010408 [Nitzschia inconspicua]